MNINNTSGLGISNQLNQTSRLIARSLQRLSTGKRINSPADDSAGYSVATNLTARIRGLQQANLNINQSVGLLQTADAAVSVQTDIAQKMRELSVSAGNGTLSAGDRAKINSQLNSLLTEFNRISNDTEFNGIKLLDGTFGTKSLTLGDLQGDNLEVSIANLQQSNAFLKTIGTGTSKTAVSYSNGTDPGDTLLSDIDGDGDLDDISIGVSEVSIRKNNGDGTFGARATLAAAAANVYVRGEDVNGDGAIDLIVSDTTANDASVFINNGDGTFKARVTYDLTAGGDLQIGDFNGDGFNDIIAATASTGVQLLTGKGDGTFNVAVTIATTGNANRVFASDFNRDGKLDFFAGTFADGNGQVALGDGSGGFTLQSVYDTTTGTSVSFGMVDVNNDGYDDIVASGTTGVGIVASISDGAGSFTSQTTSAWAGSSGQLAFGDYDRDGNMDVYARVAATITLFQGNGAGGFTAVSTTSATSTGGLAVGDLNGDGVSDFVVSGTAADVSLVHLSYTRNASAISDFTIGSTADAQLLTTVLDSTLNTLNSARTALSISMDRLQQAAEYNASMSEVYTDSKSNIEDADLGYETSELTKNQIMQQAQIAALTQSNTNMQVVLGLLQNL